MFIALFASSGNLSTPGWAYGLYIAPIWGIGFWLLIRPGPIRALEVQVGIGIIVWTLVWLNVVTININDHLGRANHAFTFSEALGVGFNEEIAKALPVLLAGLILLKFRSTKLDVRMWMFLGTIAGLTFGVSEAALYASREIVIINQAQVASQAVRAVLSFAERVFVDGFQHAVWAGISGFFVGMAVNYRRRRIPLIILGVSIPAVLHALNDWSAGAFNSYWAWILIQAVSLLLFLGYTMSAASIERHWARARLAGAPLVNRGSCPAGRMARCAGPALRAGRVRGSGTVVACGEGLTGAVAGRLRGPRSWAGPRAGCVPPFL